MAAPIVDQLGEFAIKQILGCPKNPQSGPSKNNNKIRIQQFGSDLVSTWYVWYNANTTGGKIQIISYHCCMLTGNDIANDVSHA